MAGTPPWKKYARGRKFKIETRRPLFGRQRDAHIRAYRRRRQDILNIMRAMFYVNRYFVRGKGGLPGPPRKKY